MAHLHRALATLRISGEELQPSEITKLLGAEPTLARAKGQVISRGHTSRIAQFGQWHLKAEDTEPENLEFQVVEIIGKLSKDLNVWRNLSEKYDIDLFCGWFMNQRNEGAVISTKTLSALAERNIKLSLDIYGPEKSA